MLLLSGRRGYGGLRVWRYEACCFGAEVCADACLCPLTDPLSRDQNSFGFVLKRSPHSIFPTHPCSDSSDVRMPHHTIRDQLAKHFTHADGQLPAWQLGVGVPGGAEAVVHSVQLLMDEHPDWASKLGLIHY